MHRIFDASAISYHLQNRLSQAQNVCFDCFFTSEINVTTVFIYVATAQYTSGFSRF